MRQGPSAGLTKTMCALHATACIHFYTHCFHSRTAATFHVSCPVPVELMAAVFKFWSAHWSEPSRDQRLRILWHASDPCRSCPRVWPRAAAAVRLMRPACWVAVREPQVGARWLQDCTLSIRQVGVHRVVVFVVVACRPRRAMWTVLVCVRAETTHPSIRLDTAPDTL